MSRELSDKVPPSIKRRMNSLGIKSIRQLERDMGVPHATITQYLSTDKPGVLLLMRLLRTLRYDCVAPEFDLINEICGSQALQNVDDLSTICNIKKSKVRSPKRDKTFRIRNMRAA